MFRLHTLASWRFGLCYAAEDTGGAGGKAPDSGGGTVDPSPFDDLGLPPDPDPAAQAQGDDDDDEAVLADEDAPVEGETNDQRVNRLAKAHTRLKRKWASHLPTVKRVKELRRQGLDIDELLYKARQYDELDTQFRANPRLRSYMTGESEPEGVEPPGRPRAKADAPAFDRTKLPFDPNLNDVQKWMADIGEMVHELRQETEAVKAGIDGERRTRETTTAQQAEREDKKTWKAAIDKVLPHVPRRLHGMLNDAMILAFEKRGVHKLTPQQMLGHYVIKQLGLSPKQNQAALRAAADKARKVSDNVRWPGSQRGGGAPAPAQRATVRMADIRKRLQKGASVGG